MALKVIEGKPIVDGTANHIISVAARDVDNGRLDHGGCPIARACKRDLSATDVRVYKSRAYVRQNGQWVRFIMSYALQVELVAFDRGGRFQAGDYVLYKPRPSQKLGAAKTRNPKRRTGPKRTRYLPQHTFENVRERPVSS